MVGRTTTDAVGWVGARRVLPSQTRPSRCAPCCSYRKIRAWSRFGSKGEEQIRGGGEAGAAPGRPADDSGVVQEVAAGQSAAPVCTLYGWAT